MIHIGGDHDLLSCFLFFFFFFSPVLKMFNDNLYSDRQLSVKDYDR